MISEKRIKRLHQKLLNELINYINDWIHFNEGSNCSCLNYPEPFIWDFFYQFHSYKKKPFHDFENNQNIYVLYDAKHIFEEYINDSFIFNYIVDTYRLIQYNDEWKTNIINNMKYELILKLPIIDPLPIYVLNYLICL